VAIPFADIKDLERWCDLLKRGDGTVYGFEAQMRRYDGEIIWAWLSGQAVRDDEGQILHYRGSLEDVTGRVQAKAALRENEERFRAITENTTDITAIVDQHGTFKYVSPSIERIFDYAPQELLGEFPGVWIHADDMAIIDDAFARAKQSPGKTIQIPECRAKHRDGHWLYLEGLCTNLLNVSGVGGVVFNGREITERRKTEQAIRHRNEELAALNAIAATVSRTLELEQIIHDALEEVLRLDMLGTETWGQVFLLDEQAGKLVPVAHQGVPEQHPCLRKPIHLGDCLCGLAAQRGQVILSDDNWRDERRSRRWPGMPPHKDICLPLMARGKVLGVMSLAQSASSQATERDVRFLVAISDQIGVAIENARLYQETARRWHEAEILGAVTADLTRTLDLDQVLHSILDSAMDLIPASGSGVIHLVDETTQKLVPLATSTPGASVKEKSDMIIGEGIAGLVMKEKQTIRIPDATLDPRFLEIESFMPKRSLLTAPLLVEKECIGTLSLNSDRVNAFSTEDERLLTTLADQAAIALWNARLHSEVERRVEELTFLNHVGRTVASSLDLEQVLTTVMEETKTPSWSLKPWPVRDRNRPRVSAFHRSRASPAMSCEKDNRCWYPTSHRARTFTRISTASPALPAGRSSPCPWRSRE
jgi:PAS domain S-box-containing protein